MPSAGCSLPGRSVVISAGAAAAQSGRQGTATGSLGCNEMML